MGVVGILCMGCDQWSDLWGDAYKGSCMMGNNGSGLVGDEQQDDLG